MGRQLVAASYAGVHEGKTAVTYRCSVLERYSDDARRAVSIAGQEARTLGHGHVGTEHLLLGLLAQRGTAAAEALTSGGASLAACREKVVEALASRQPEAAVTAGGDLPFTDRAARAIDRASRLSLRMGSETVSSEHLLLSVLDVEGTAGQVLRGSFVDLAAVREAVVSPVSLAESRSAAVSTPVPGDAGEPPPETTVEPTCGTCGSALSGSLGFTHLSAAGEHSSMPVEIVYCTVCGAVVGSKLP